MTGPIVISILGDGANANRALNDVGSNAEKMGNAIKAASAVAAAGLAAVTAAAMEAADQSAETARAAAARGLDPAAQKRAGQMAGRLYAQAYGESFGDVTRSVEAVASSFPQLGEKQLEQASKDAMNLASIFEVDLPGAVSTAATVVKSGLAGDVTEAFDLITAASQQVPAALRQDLLDSVAEYSPYFADLGLSGEQAFALLADSAKQGGIGIDKAGDSVKEFGIRATDMSTSSVAAYDAIGLNANEMANDLLAGGNRAQDATQKIVKGLLGIKDPAKRANASIALFGTPLEDLGVNGIPDFLRSLANAEGGLGKFEGSAKRAGNTLNDNTKAKITEFKRTITQTFVEEVGKRALPVLDDLAEKGTKVANAFRSGGLDSAVSEFEELTGTGGKLAPILDQVEGAFDAVERIAKKVGPAALDAADGMEGLAAPLKLVDDVLGTVADVLEAVPDDVLTLGIQAGAAALLLPRLTGAVSATTGALGTMRARVQQVRAEMTYLETRTQRVQGAMGAMGGAAKTAAGIGGLLALSASAQEADRETGILLGTLGGAATGFAVGGPWGALIGGAAGAAMGIFADRTDEAAESMEQAERPAADYAATLDELTGATTKATRAAVYQQVVNSGALSWARELGVGTRDVVGAILGQEGAMRRINDQMAKSGDITLSYVDAQGQLQVQTVKTQAEADNLTRELALQGIEVDKISKVNPAKSGLLNFIGRETDAWRASTKAKRQEILATQDMTALYKKIPKRVVSKIEQTGVVPTVRGIAKVADRYKLLDGKQIRSLIKVTGTDITVKQVRRVLDQMGAVDNVRPNLRDFSRGIDTGTRNAANAADRGGKKIKKNAEDPVRQTRADLGNLQQTTNSGLNSAASQARSGGVGIGAAIKQGFTSGFSGADGLWSSSVRSAVAAAIRAGRQQAGIKSPSRETHYMGRMMGEGLAKGLAESEALAKKRGKNLVAAALAGIAGGSGAIENALSKITKLVEKSIDLKDDKKERQREAAILRGLKAEFTQLKANGKAQDANNQKLIAARDALKNLQATSAAYAANIRTGFRNFGSAVGLGIIGEGGEGVSIKDLLKQLEQRKIQAQRFTSLVEKLRKDGLNQTQIQALLDAGVEGGLATAEAIAQGGKAAIAEVNRLTADIDRAGSQLGTSSANALYAAGIRAAQGVVNELEREEKRLDKVGRRIARSIVAELREAGIGPKDKKDKADRNAERYQAARTFGHSSTKTQPDVIEIRLSADAADEVAQGKKIIRRIDKARTAGATSAKLVFAK
ncbi:phage tail tape measure protein [Nocardioides sp. GXZ039]|uniref:phage tail tape measure protein n=1 Tax=Nocardioides sp. GXZ039 TaxID=3136018 RepID=UPI0030F3BFE2